jgi:dTDP-4-dehydrorhamnose reductase
MRVLVTGGGGLIGGRLVRLLEGQRFRVSAGHHIAPPPTGISTVPLDLLSQYSVESALDAARADAVVHCASFVGADECERRPLEAHEMNARAAGALAASCRARAIRLLALSTDQVLAGDVAFAAEREPPRPLMVYGRTKLEGEEAVLSALPTAAVVRLPLMIGRGHGPRGTASEAIRWSLRDGARVRLFTDEYRTPVDPESVAAALTSLLEGEGAGMYHLGGGERLSRYELGLRVARVFDLSPSLLEPVPQSVHAGPPRPLDASLDSGRARRELGWAPRPLDEALRESRPEPG